MRYLELFGLSSVLAPEDDGDCGFAVLEPDGAPLVCPAPEPVAPAEAPPFIISLNSLRLSCPSLFLSALSKSNWPPARLEPLAPLEADEESRLALASLEALPLAPAELLPLCDMEGFACVSLCFLVSCA